MAFIPNQSGLLLPQDVYARIVNVGANPPSGTVLANGDVNATRFLKNGVAIDSNAAYSNIAYIDRQNTFTGTTQTAPTFNGSTNLKYAGNDINTAAALSNVAYLSRATEQSFTAKVAIPNQPYVLRYLGVNITLTTGVMTDVLWDTLSGSVVDVTYAAGTGVFTINTTGTYLILSSLIFNSNATGQRVMQILLNGTAYGASGLGANAGGNHIAMCAAGPIPLAATSVVKVQAQQTSGGNLALVAAGVLSYVSITRLW